MTKQAEANPLPERVKEELTQQLELRHKRRPNTTTTKSQYNTKHKHRIRKITNSNV